MPCLCLIFIAQRSPLYSHFSETLTGLSSIRAYGEQASFIAVNEQKLDNNNRAYYMQIQSQRWLALRLDFVGALIVGCAALVAALLAQSLSPGLVGLSISYALQVRIFASALESFFTFRR
jgi:ABC-type multidrug transport system fused ATPase/permease subunit